MTAVTPTERPKSVRNRCVIEVLVAIFYVVKLLFGFFCECRGFCHRIESDLFPFLLMLRLMKPRDLIALFVMLSMCVVHSSLLVIVMPKYFACGVFSSVCPCSV